MIPTQTAPDTDRSVWWVGDGALRWRDAFVQWLGGPDSPRRPQSTWRLHVAGYHALSLPRLPTRWHTVPHPATPVVVWTIPATGIAELVHRMGHVRHTRPGYLHLSAGLASPAERMHLSEIGVSAHVQSPGDWPVYRKLFDTR